MALFTDYSQSAHVAPGDTSAIVQSSDIPILSSTDRLQRTLLKWVDVCGLSGQFVSDVDVIDALSDNDLLDEQSYLVELEGEDPSRWMVLWSGENVVIETDAMFRDAFVNLIPEDRFIELVAREYWDAVRYRRASARRFAHRVDDAWDTMDQLIFPIRDPGRAEYVLIIGEAVSGRSVYREVAKQHQDVEMRND